MSGLLNWDYRAAGNTAAVPDGFPEGMLPRDPNNCFREVMAQIALSRDRFQTRNWNIQTPAGMTRILTCVYSAALGYWFVGCTNGSTFRSVDGRTWTSSGTVSPARAESIAAGTLPSGQACVVLVDSTGSVSICTGTSFGAAVRPGSIPPTSPEIAYGNGRWAITGWGGLVYTDDPAGGWVNAVHGGASALYEHVAWASTPTGPMWVAVGAVSGLSTTAIYTSSDGANWTSRQSGVSGTLAGVAWFPAATTGAAALSGMWVAVGYVGSSPLIYTSPDGLVWTARTSSLSASLFSVAPTVSGAVAVIGGAEGRCETSVDGITWIPSGTSNIVGTAVIGRIASGHMPGGDLLLMGGTWSGNDVRLWESRIV